MRNPFLDVEKALGVAGGTLLAAQNAVKAFCQANADKEELPDAAVQATHPALADVRVFNEVKKALGV